MAPSSTFPDFRTRGTAWLCGPEKEKSSFFAMPFSKRSMCSGNTMPDCTTCRSCSTFGSALARQAARKSACFWLSPSRQIRSLGRITASSSAVASFGATIFPAANLLPAARRSPRARCSLCQSAMWFNLLMLPCRHLLLIGGRCSTHATLKRSTSQAGSYIFVQYSPTRIHLIPSERSPAFSKGIPQGDDASSCLSLLGCQSTLARFTQATLFNDIAIALVVLDVFLVIIGWPTTSPDESFAETYIEKP